MTRWIALAVLVGLSAASPQVFAAQRMTKPDASAGRAVFDGRRHTRYVEVTQTAVRHDPPYYARPVYCRPYPYGVPAPFVFGYGPFW